MAVRQFLSDRDARRAILDIGRRMYAKNFVAANDGNISVRVAGGAVWATPTGVSKGFMREKDLVKMGLDGRVLKAGALAPSSEIKMHLRVYQENPGVGGVTHAHPPACTSFAIAGISLDRAVYPEALVTLGVVPCVHYERPGSQGIPDSVAPYCKSHNAVLLSNHGALSWGRDLTEAWYRLESMEHYALILICTGKLLGRARVLSRSQVDELLEIRKGLGVTSGGAPPHCAAAPSNLADVTGAAFEEDGASRRDAWPENM
jgi:L-fuculose-phosphate aldolase